MFKIKGLNIEVVLRGGKIIDVGRSEVVMYFDGEDNGEMEEEVGVFVLFWFVRNVFYVSWWY